MSDQIRIATVSQVNAYIKRMLDSNGILKNIWIKGELSNCKVHYSGHIYLTIKDETGVISGVMFKTNAQTLTFQPEDGMKIIARGRVSVYERDGRYQIYIEEMVQDGLGNLHIEFEKLKKKLDEQGLFDPEHKKPLPQFPKRIGIVTATTGAAIRDMINVSGRRFPLADIVIYPSLVQGENAALNIIKGIHYFDNAPDIDVIIIGRGGGSIEDLWAFNDENLAYEIYSCNTPIISAVGHETDFTISDFVADLRAPTPSAAAELAVPSDAEIKALFKSIDNKILYCMNNMIKHKQLQVNSLKPTSPKHKIDEQIIYTDMLTKQIFNSINNKYEKLQKQFSKSCGKLDSLSPIAVLARGYSMARTSDGKVIKTVSQAKDASRFSLTLSDGNVDCVVQ